MKSTRTFLYPTKHCTFNNLEAGDKAGLEAGIVNEVAEVAAEVLVNIEPQAQVTDAAPPILLAGSVSKLPTRYGRAIGGDIDRDVWKHTIRGTEANRKLNAAEAELQGGAKQSAKQTVLIGGSNSLTRSSLDNFPVYIYVDSLGRSLLINDQQAIVVTDSYLSAAETAYEQWKNGKVSNAAPGSFPLPQSLQDLLHAMQTDGKITEQQKLQYVREFSQLNADKLRRRLIVRIANAGTQEVQMYCMWTTPIYNPSVFQVQKLIVCKTKHMKLDKKQMQDGMVLDADALVVNYDATLSTV